MTDIKFVQTSAPSTVANLSVGFDLLGMSAPVLKDIVTLTRNNSKEVSIKLISGDQGKLSKQVSENTAGMPVLNMLKKSNSDFGIDIAIEKGIPLSSGLGGSAASAVAATLGMNKLLGDIYTQEELIEFALDGEEIASGARHRDNVAPALIGGLVACLANGKTHSLSMPPEIYCLLIHPDIEINTKDARRVLNTEISHQQSIQQSSYLLGFMSGIIQSNKNVIFENLKDIIVTPQRKHLIPRFDEIAQIALAHKGTELSISGAGPTMFSLFSHQHDAEDAANKLSSYQTWVCEVPGPGAKVELVK